MSVSGSLWGWLFWPRLLPGIETPRKTPYKSDQRVNNYLYKNTHKGGDDQPFMSLFMVFLIHTYCLFGLEETGCDLENAADVSDVNQMLAQR